MRNMLLGPFVVALICVAADWVVWDWAIATDKGGVALVAGLAMAPLVVTLAWFGTLLLVNIVRFAINAVRREIRLRTQPQLRVARAVRFVDYEAEGESDRLAA